MRERIYRSLSRVVSWIQAHDYQAYEPADGNLSPLFRLTMGKVTPMRLLQQLVLRAPLNIRPLLGIRPHDSPIGRGYMAASYLLMDECGLASKGREEAIRCLEWLIHNRARGYTEYCWGDPYEYATRSGRRPYGEPLLIWTAVIGLAFLEASLRLRCEKYLDVARSIGRWVRELPREETSAGTCLSYVAFRRSFIHNASIMGGAFLLRLGIVTACGESGALGRQALRYTCARQRPNGSWFYAEEAKFHWIDSFHTGYNLCALMLSEAALPDNPYADHLAVGAEYFKQHFFEASGRPRYFHDRTFPVDIQCAAQAIETLTKLSSRDGQSIELASKVAQWTIKHMQAPDGHFYYRHLGWTTVKTPMLHWGQATMAKALVSLLASTRGVEHAA